MNPQRRRPQHRIRRKRLGRPFASLWVGLTLASSGDGLAAGAVPLLAVVVNPHPLAVSSVVAADSLPWLLLTLPAGAFADRFERGRLMAISNAFRAITLLAGGFLILSGRITLSTLLLVVLINAGMRAVYYSTLQSVVPDLVEPDGLEQANGALTGTEAASEHLAGPIVGTWLFAMTKAVPFFADALATLLSCFPFFSLRLKAAQPVGSSSVWEGARVLVADRRLRTLLVFVGSLAGLQGMGAGILVLLATGEWGISKGAYGVFLAAGAAGNLLGSLSANRLVRRLGSGGALIGTALISGAGYLLMASANGWGLAGPAFALVGFAVGAGSLVAISLRQRLTPEDLMERVGRAWRGLVWGAAPLGALAAGALGTLVGLRLPLSVAGVLQCVVAGVLARPILQSLRADQQVLTVPPVDEVAEVRVAEVTVPHVAEVAEVRVAEVTVPHVAEVAVAPVAEVAEARAEVKERPGSVELEGLRELWPRLWPWMMWSIVLGVFFPLLVLYTVLSMDLDRWVSIKEIVGQGQLLAAGSLLLFGDLKVLYNKNSGYKQSWFVGSLIIAVLGVVAWTSIVAQQHLHAHRFETFSVIGGIVFLGVAVLSGAMTVTLTDESEEEKSL